MAEKPAAAFYMSRYKIIIRTLDGGGISMKNWSDAILVMRIPRLSPYQRLYANEPPSAASMNLISATKKWNCSAHFQCSVSTRTNEYVIKNNYKWLTVKTRLELHQPA